MRFTSRRKLQPSAAGVNSFDTLRGPLDLVRDGPTDADRFDALSRALTTQGSRRTTLGVLLGTLLSGVLSGASPETRAERHKRNGNRPGKKGGRAKTDRGKDSGKEHRNGSRKGHHTPQDQQPTDEQTLDLTEDVAAAETREMASDEVTAADHGCRHAGSGCRRGRQCCTGKCLRSGKRSCNASNPCPTPSDPCKQAVWTSTGRCVIQDKVAGTDCGDGKVCCGKSCVDTQTNPTHCGNCGNRCLSGEICTNGKCLCASGNVVCGGACVAGNCCKGDSGVTCNTGEKCCSPSGCVDVLGADLENCGDCGVVCDPDSADRCTNGTCSCGVDVCVGSEVCKVTGCECPDATSCQDICKEGKVICGGECLDCPPPPPGIDLPGSEPESGTCCETNSECSCGGKCCSNKDDCFQTFDRRTNEVVDEFCCTESGGIVCGNECCHGPSCETGCFRMNPVGGSYRRPGR